MTVWYTIRVYMKQLKTIFITAFIVCLCIFALSLYLHVSEITKNTGAVVREIRALNRWETASFTIEKIIETGSSGNVFQQFLFGNRILLITQGVAIGGFDLSGISDKNISIQNTTLTVTLPAPQILQTTIDTTKTRVYDRQQGILVAPDNNLETQALSAAQKSIRDEACAKGILQNSSDNARKLLMSILSTVGFTKIVINIPSGSC